MGDSITEGLLSEYVKKVGDPVNVDDVLVIIETDKVAVDVRSEVSYGGEISLRGIRGRGSGRPARGHRTW